MPSSKGSNKKAATTTESYNTTTTATTTKSTLAGGNKKTGQKSTNKTVTSTPAPTPKSGSSDTVKTTASVTPTNDVIENQKMDESNESDMVETSITENFSEFITKFQTMIAQFAALKTELRVLEKKTVKQLKVVQKFNNKKKRKAQRAPSGFVKPAPISDELASFLGKPLGSEMARTDVTREINKYIRANNLQDKENGRQINPDKQLSQLLKIDNAVTLTYFNLQRYMGPHFPKQTKGTDVTNEVVA